MDAMERAAVTNQRVADELGVTHSMISRIRSGDRAPSLDLMLKIHEDWNWSLPDQALARSMGEYAVEFEAVLTKRFGA